MIRLLSLSVLLGLMPCTVHAEPGELRSAEPASTERGLLAGRPLPALRKSAGGSAAIPLTLDGYDVSPFAASSGGVSALAVHESAGSTLVFGLDTKRGRIMRFEDRGQDGASDQAGTYISGLDRPSGLRVYDGMLYYADRRGIWASAIERGLSPARPPLRIVDLSGVSAAPAPRPFAITADGKTILIGFSAAAQDTKPLAPQQAIIAVDRASGAAQIFAADLGNILALNTTPSGQVLALTQGVGAARAQLRVFTALGVQSAALEFEPGGGPSDIMLMPKAAQGGADWGDALIAFAGAETDGRGGYHVSALSFSLGAPNPQYRVIVDGFASAARRSAWGRPKGLAALSSGEILIADDWSETLWRLSKSAAPIAAPQPQPEAGAAPDITPAQAEAPIAGEDEKKDVEEEEKTTRIRIGGQRPARGQSVDAP